MIEYWVRLSDKRVDSDELMRSSEVIKDNVEWRFYYIVYRVFYKPPKDKVKLIRIEETSIQTLKSVDEESYLLSKAKSQTMIKINSRYIDDPDLDRIQFYEPVFNNLNEAKELLKKLS